MPRHYHLYVKAPTPNMTVFGGRLFKEDLKLREIIRVGPLSDKTSVHLRRHQRCLSPYAQRGTAIWGHSDKAAVCKTARETLPKTNLQAPWPIQKPLAPRALDTVLRADWVEPPLFRAYAEALSVIHMEHWREKHLSASSITHLAALGFYWQRRSDHGGLCSFIQVPLCLC